jgi:hypothetical protein
MREMYRRRMNGVQVHSMPFPEALPQGQGLAASTSWKRAG